MGHILSVRLHRHCPDRDAAGGVVRDSDSERRVRIERHRRGTLDGQAGTFAMATEIRDSDAASDLSGSLQRDGHRLRRGVRDRNAPGEPLGGAARAHPCATELAALPKRTKSAARTLDLADARRGTRS